MNAHSLGRAPVAGLPAKAQQRQQLWRGRGAAAVAPPQQRRPPLGAAQAALFSGSSGSGSWSSSSVGSSCSSEPCRRPAMQQLQPQQQRPRPAATCRAAGPSQQTAAAPASAAPAAPQPAAAPPAASPPPLPPTLASPALAAAAAVPPSVLTDSYKASHFLQYPAAARMVAYGEFRQGFDKDKTDQRVAWYGIRYIVENYVARRWTAADVAAADAFYATHLAPGNGAFPFPRDLFARFVEENGGYFPVKIQALPEGTAAHARVPVYQITAEGAYAPLCTFLETLLTMAWYPTTVATLSRRARDAVAAAFEESVDGGAASPLLPSRLHDFGFRGCATVEQSVVGGCAHLLNFEGTDTMSAAFYAQVRAVVVSCGCVL